MNIFVSNISFKVREGALNELFTQYGEVKAVRIIKDRESHRSKGYGFVEMTDDQAGHAAIAGLNGTLHYGRNLIVAEAKGKKETDSNNTEFSASNNSPDHGSSQPE